MNPFHASLLIIALLLAGCGKDKGLLNQVATLTEEVSALRAKLDEIQNKEPTFMELIEQERIKQIEQQLIKLNAFKDTALEVFSMGHRPAALRVASQGSMSVTSNDFGSFAVCIENIEPYLDGHKVKLKVGSLMNADLRSDISLSLPVITKDLPDGSKPEKPRSFRANLGELLPGGKWNDVEIIAPNTKPKDFEMFFVTIDCTAVSMSK